MTNYIVTVLWLLGSKAGQNEVFEVEAYTQSIATNLVQAACTQSYCIEIQGVTTEPVTQIISVA
jgi:hypothetical protein